MHCFSLPSCGDFQSINGLIMTCMSKYTRGEKREKLKNVVSPEGDFLVVWRALWLGALMG